MTLGEIKEAVRVEHPGLLRTVDRSKSDQLKLKLAVCEKSLEELSDDMDAGIVQDHAQWLKMWNVWAQRRDSLRRGVMVYW